MRRTPAASAEAAVLAAPMAVGLGEAVAVPHGVHQVVDGVDAVEARFQGVEVPHVSPHNLDLLPPAEARGSLGLADEAAHIAAGVEQLGYEPPADVAGGAQHRDARHPAVLSMITSSSRVTTENLPRKFGTSARARWPASLAQPASMASSLS